MLCLLFMCACKNIALRMLKNMEERSGAIIIILKLSILKVGVRNE